MTNGSGGSFATTQWHLVYDAARRDELGGREALGELCQRYRYPLYSYLRRKGLSHADAEDSLHSFFIRLLDSEFLAAADHRRGRFRSFLASSLQNFLANERRAAAAMKRGGQTLHLSLDLSDADDRFRNEPADPHASPEQAFDRQWAWTLVEQAIESLRQDWEKQGKGEQFRVLQSVLTPGEVASSYAQLAESLEMTEGALKVAVHRLRQECGRRIRDEIRRTVADDAEVEDELKRLFLLLGQPVS